MMQLAGSLRREFTGRSEAAAFQRFQQQQHEERKRRDREEDIGDDTAELLDMAALIVTEREIREFRFAITRYDAVTVEALLENETALELILKQKEEMLARAYVLPDGRRVFKSEDGIRVFDEHGIELDASDVDPDLIGARHPSWEAYRPILEESMRLAEERRALLAYQAKLDEARERLDAGDLTREEFDRLRGDMVTDMPEAVRNRIPELAGEQQPEAGQSAQTAVDLDLSDDMIPGSGPVGLAPGMGR